MVVFFLNKNGLNKNGQNKQWAKQENQVKRARPTGPA
jgi:hypothetical protein